MTSSVSVRREVLDLVLPIPEEFRISADGYLVGVLPFLGEVHGMADVLGHYRMHADNSWTRMGRAKPNTMIEKKLEHWKRTVDTTNIFLERLGRHERLDLSDHYPYQLALWHRSNGRHVRDMLKLTKLGLRFQGEPSIERRTKEVVKLWLGHVGFGFRSAWV